MADVVMLPSVGVGVRTTRHQQLRPESGHSASPIASGALERYALAHDASHYLLIPEGVATPDGISELRALLRYCRESDAYLTFRSGGTSLSGQGVTAGVLVDSRKHFRDLTVLDSGTRLRVEPGVTVRRANAHLLPYGRKLGPDPASEVACTLGGVIANNSSGMACGTTQNTYQTLESMEVVLASGTVLDTGARDADERLRMQEPELYAGIAALTRRVRENPISVDTIRHQFSMKNTMGYGLNSFLDFDRPVDVLTHLMIGSEGTLGFVAAATFRTVEILAASTTGLAVFHSLQAAMAALPDLVQAGYATIELLDNRSLLVAQRQGGVPENVVHLDLRDHAALLLEHRAASGEELQERQQASERLVSDLDLALPLSFTTEPATQASLWHMRKGLYTAVAEARPSGTTALLEDIVVPVANMLHTCESLTTLFEQYSYEESVIFGHAKDGNLHFMLNEIFNDVNKVERYELFTEDMVTLVLSQHGSLKAEHGTGRIMAPFVRRQYGDELYDVMKRVKALLDPHAILNPGVVLSDDPRSYLQDFKISPTVEQEIDNCVECGYCEPTCPSQDLTLTPRQRIALRRELVRTAALGDTGLHEELREGYRYAGLETCAADGMCQTTCPVGINTGDLVRRLRMESVGALDDRIWNAAARHWDKVTAAGSRALTVASVAPRLATSVTILSRRALGDEQMPCYNSNLPRGGRRRSPVIDPNPVAVYFPSCIGTIFGPEPLHDGVEQAFLTLCDRAGVAVTVPHGIEKWCCGTPWKSKGLSAGYRSMGNTVLPALLAASRGGELPVVCDAASCTEGLEELRGSVAQGDDAYSGLEFLDVIEFVHSRLLSHLEVTAPADSIVIHPTCSTERRGTSSSLMELARFISDDVTVPVDWGCCAFAGDRGLLHPELTASATMREIAEIRSRHFSVYASANRTCEIGMTRATGRAYVHVVEALERATRPRTPTVWPS